MNGNIKNIIIVAGAVAAFVALFSFWGAADAHRIEGMQPSLRAEFDRIDRQAEEIYGYNFYRK